MKYSVFDGRYILGTVGTRGETLNPGQGGDENS
jgi:hypothetical protein